jgi:hypothetical protein
MILRNTGTVFVLFLLDTNLFYSKAYHSLLQYKKPQPVSGMPPFMYGLESWYMLELGIPLFGPSYKGKFRPSIRRKRPALGQNQPVRYIGPL